MGKWAKKRAKNTIKDEIYNRLSKIFNIENIPISERYIMRKDRAGEILDKRAMRIVSKAMGHNRIDVIALNYLYRT